MSKESTLGQHTKGGWGRNIPPAAKYPIIFAGRNTHVVQILSRGLPESETEANANLVAAAPALLEALQALLACASDETLNRWDAIIKAQVAVNLAGGIYRGEG